MLCSKCGYYSETEETVCPACGEILKHDSGVRSTGAQAIRQGKRAREAAKTRPETGKNTPENRRRRSGASHATIQLPSVQDTRESVPATEFMSETGQGESEDAGAPFERRRRNIYDDEADEETSRRYMAAYEGDPGSRRHLVNWIKVTIIATVCLLIVLVAGYFFLTRSDAGQRIMARMGRDADSAALWAVGDELMSTGDIDGAISCFEKAMKQDEADGVVDVDGLLMLGNAYEAAERIDDAASLYEKIYEETPSRSEAYVNHIRILQNSQKPGDLAKAGELLKTAYEKTGDGTFLSQRSDMLPAPPEVNLTAGYYETKKSFSITSYQGYDVYYTFDDEAELPFGGTKFTEPITLEEGIHNLRAVAVNGELVSDELRGTYKIIMPRPQTPQCNLAPNTYRNSQRVKLKPGKDNINDADIIIYYTVDGSNPDADSPIYNGEAIQLPNGKVTLKAIAVNRYRKLSNMLEVGYKIEANPKPKTAFTAEDTLDDIVIGSTSLIDFESRYGEGTMAGIVKPEGYDTECRRYDYPWGYIITNLARRNWVVVEVYCEKSGVFTAPRGTAIGDTEKYVVDKFRDMLQVESSSGNRGLYANDNGSGKIWAQENGRKIIRYQYTGDGRSVQLEYHLGSDGTVSGIDLKHIP